MGVGGWQAAAMCGSPRTHSPWKQHCHSGSAPHPASGRKGLVEEREGVEWMGREVGRWKDGWMGGWTER